MIEKENPVNIADRRHKVTGEKVRYTIQQVIEFTIDTVKKIKNKETETKSTGFP